METTNEVTLIKMSFQEQGLQWKHLSEFSCLFLPLGAVDLIHPSIILKLQWDIMDWSGGYRNIWALICNAGFGILFMFPRLTKNEILKKAPLDWWWISASLLRCLCMWIVCTLCTISYSCNQPIKFALPMCMYCSVVHIPYVCVPSLYNFLLYIIWFWILYITCIPFIY